MMKKYLTVVTLALCLHFASASSSAQKMSPQQALVEAINQENLTKVQVALKNEANVNTPNSSGTTPLMTLSLVTAPTMSPLIPYLVSEGASLTAKDHNGCTPLDYALLGFTPGTIAFLKSKNAPAGTNALVNAINQNNIPEIEKLLKNGANPNLVIGEGSLLTLLTCSTTPNSLHIAELLLKSGANVDEKDMFGNTPLMNSTGEENLDMAKLLLHYKANLNLQDHYGQTALMIAVNRKNPSLSIINALLHAPDSTQSINIPDKNGLTPLMYAVNSNNIPIAQALITAGAKTTPQASEEYYSSTALIFALTNKTPSLPIVQALLHAPDITQSINLQDSTGYTALMWAVTNNNLSLTQMLVAAGAHTTLQANKANYLTTALLIAVLNQPISLPLVQALLQAPDIKNSIDMQDFSGYTALMYAVSSNHLPLTEALISSGARTTPQSNQANDRTTALVIAVANQNQPPSLPLTQALLKASDSRQSINIPDAAGWTPLMYAAYRGSVPIVQALLTAGADVTYATPNGQTALSISQQNCTPALQAAYSQTLYNDFFNAVATNDLAGVKKALAAKANPSYVVESCSMLIMAITQNNTAITQALIDAKADVNFQDNKGATALIYAAFNNNLDLVKALLAAGANPNLQTNAANGSTTALLLATKAGNEAMVKALLKAPTISQSINTQDSTGATALIYAVQSGNTALVKALTQVKGINANLQDNTGMTALMYAAQNSLFPVLQLLVKIPNIHLNMQNMQSNNQTILRSDWGPGSTALDFASNQKCINFLQKLGGLYAGALPSN
jgi:ankyrin repeat protein